MYVVKWKGIFTGYLCLRFRMSVVSRENFLSNTLNFSSPDVRYKVKRYFQKHCQVFIKKCPLKYEGPCFIHEKIFLKMMQPFDEKMSVVKWGDKFSRTPKFTKNLSVVWWYNNFFSATLNFSLGNVRCKVEGDFSHDIPSFPVSMSVGARISDSVKIY